MIRSFLRRVVGYLYRRLGLDELARHAISAGSGSLHADLARTNSDLESIRSSLALIHRTSDQAAWADVQFFDPILKRHGCLRSTANLSPELKFDLNQWFQYKEKSEVALSVATCWAGGDYFEFGSTDMNTFRNFLSAYDIYDLDARFPDTRFYAFDIFGKTWEMNDETKSKLEVNPGYADYMNCFTARGDLLEENWGYLRDHGLYVDRCHLIQGYFEETLTPELKKTLLEQKRSIGFACLDCNIAPPYKTVFEFIFDLMAPTSYIYMDEYTSGSVQPYFKQFEEALREKRRIGTYYIRNAGGFGGLVGLYPLDRDLSHLEL